MSEQYTDKKQYILDAAEKLFSKYGFDATSTREIAEKAGANVAMISYYFGSKENLISAIIERYSIKIVTILKDEYNPKLNAEERLNRIIEAYLDWSFSHPDPVIIARREIGVNLRPVLRDSIQCTFTQVRDMVSDIIKDGQNEDVYRQVDVPLLLHSIGGMVDSMLIEAYSLKMMGIDLKPFGLLDIEDPESRKRITAFVKEITHCYLKKT